MNVGRLRVRWGGESPDSITPVLTIDEDDVEIFAKRWFHLTDMQELVSASSLPTTWRAWSAKSNIGRDVTVEWEPQ